MAAAGGDQQSILKVLISSDNHLGFAERDPVRGNDSFETFEEVLKLAKSLGADLLLLAGDLFHENKPSRPTLHRCMTLLRSYCLGDSPVSFSVLNSAAAAAAAAAASTRNSRPNYEDPNYNVSLPVYAIHGNHDDPSGAAGLAALDVLSAANLLNYIGKTETCDEVSLAPVLIAKGETRVALYGLGNVRDERLHRTFERRAVKVLRPAEEADRWFSILALHQNRSAHSPKGYLNEGMLDGCGMEFVVWGHEHECLIAPTPSSSGSFYVCQPGSTVAVALTEGEARKKHCGLLEIHKDQFRLKAIPLTTVRPFVLDSVLLREIANPGQTLEAISAAIADRVSQLAETAGGNQSAGGASGGPAAKLPIVRLKVDSTGFASGTPPINPQKFGQAFVGKVANPSEILTFCRTADPAAKKAKRKSVDGSLVDDDMGQAGGAVRAVDEAPSAAGIGDLISEMLGSGDGLRVLCMPELQNALKEFVDKEEKEAIADIVRESIERAQKELRANAEADDDDKIVKALERLSIERAAAMVAASQGPGVGEDDNAANEKSGQQDMQVQAGVDALAADELLRRVAESAASACARPPSPTNSKRGRKPAAASEDEDEVVAASDQEDKQEETSKGRGRAGAQRKKKQAAATQADGDDDYDENPKQPANKKTKKDSAPKAQPKKAPPAKKSKAAATADDVETQKDGAGQPSQQAAAGLRSGRTCAGESQQRPIPIPSRRGGASSRKCELPLTPSQQSTQPMSSAVPSTTTPAGQPAAPATTTSKIFGRWGKQK